MYKNYLLLSIMVVLIQIFINPIRSYDTLIHIIYDVNIHNFIRTVNLPK